MKHRDISSIGSGEKLRVDLAIVGTGPAGLAIAHSLAGSGIRILLVESGGMAMKPGPQSLNAVERVGPDRSGGDQEPGRGYDGMFAWLNEVPAFELRNRGFGGSTATWAGKCADFQAIDFEQRDWVPHSGWPMERADFDGYLDRAATLLGLGPNVYDERLGSMTRSALPPAGIDAGRLAPFFWQFSLSKSGGPLRLRETFLSFRAPNVTVLTHATVTEIVTDADGSRVRHLRIAGPEGRRAIVRPRFTVLCAGAVENARLLLASNAARPQGIGNDHGLVGRYLCDHPRTAACRLPQDQGHRIQSTFGFYALRRRHGGHRYLRGATLPAALQRRERLLNCAAYLVRTHSDADPWAALKRQMSGSPSARDLMRVAASPGLLARGLVRHGLMGRSVLHLTTGMRFDAMVEQVPNPDSRVTLSARTDQFGGPLPRIDWRIGDLEARTVARLAQLLTEEFEHAGFSPPLLPEWVRERRFEDAPFIDMGHPSGTTRMADDPSRGVVDARGKVFGVEGLFVAGSSTFPTPGHANPTLMIVAQSMRVADVLKEELVQSATYAVTPVGPAARAAVRQSVHSA